MLISASTMATANALEAQPTKANPATASAKNMDFPRAVCRRRSGRVPSVNSMLSLWLLDKQPDEKIRA